MNDLIQTLSGLRVLCGETIQNCFPIHKIFMNSNEQTGQEEEEEEEQKHSNDDVQRYQQNNTNINSKQILFNEETDRLNSSNHQYDSHLHNEDFSTNSTTQPDTTSCTFDSLIIREEQNTQKQPEHEPQQQQQIVQQTPPTQQQQPKKKQMLGMIEEDKIQQIEKKDEADDVDYFSEMSMGITQPSFKAPAKVIMNTTGTTKVEKQSPKQESKFTVNQVEDEDVLESAGWGNDADDIEL